MTINNYCIHHYADCPKFAFGIPLEDIFPAAAIHPAIEMLLQTAYLSVMKCDYSLEVIVSKLQGTLNHRLGLKNKILNWKPYESIKGHPGALLWIVRHFLGLLPLPILPDYANQQTFNWLKLSELCRNVFINNINEERDNRYLIEKITKDLLKLPEANMLLLRKLIKFFRKIVTCPYYRDQRLRKSTCFGLVRYYCSAMFIRPFRPGNVTKIDKQYHPLLLYLIIKWPNFERHSVLKKQEVSTLYQEILIPSKHSIQPILEESQSVKDVSQTNLVVTDNCTQTSLGEDSLLRLVPYIYYYDTNQYLKDISCQTDSLEVETKKVEAPNNIYKVERKENKLDAEGSYTKYDDVDEDIEKISSDVLSHDNPDYLTGSFHDFFIKEQDKDNPEAAVKAPIFQPGFLKDYKESRKGIYGWVYSNPSDASETQSFTPKSEGEGYIYDEYCSFQFDDCKSDQNLIATSKSSINAHMDKDDNDSIMHRISKIGWSYSTPRDSPYKTCKQPATSYRLYFDEKEEDSFGNKEGNVEVLPCLKEMNIVTPTPKNSKKRLSLSSITKMASKFDFMKMFSSKRNDVKSTSSADQLTGSSVKYRKMESTRSSFF